jgi:hypothetical protein
VILSSALGRIEMNLVRWPRIVTTCLPDSGFSAQTVLQHASMTERIVTSLQRSSLIIAI